jgi:hypothetical protein
MKTQQLFSKFNILINKFKTIYNSVSFSKFKTAFNPISNFKFPTLLLGRKIKNYFTMNIIRLLIILFVIVYSFFFMICIYFLYKSHLNNLSNLNNFTYINMSKDISRLNLYHPIQTYLDIVPSKNHINYVYGKLGIINYNDYIYSMTSDTQTLQHILRNNSTLHQNTSSIVFADIISQHSQLFADLTEEFIKKVFKLSRPLVISVVLLGGFMLLEPNSLVTLYN